MSKDLQANSEEATVGDDTETESSTTDDSGVDISEEFQKEASELLDDASPEELRWLSSKASKMCYEMEYPKKDAEMSTEGMPQD